MSLPLQSSAFITCALTGAGDSTGISDKVPVTPEQIAESALEAAAAGAAVVHIHVREPETGKGSRRPEYFREVAAAMAAAAGGPPDQARMMDIMRRYGLTPAAPNA